MGTRTSEHRWKRASGSSCKSSSKLKKHYTQHKNEIRSENKNPNGDENEMGNGVENRKEHRTTPATHEPTTRRHFRTQVIQKHAETGTCSMDLKTPNRTLPSERVPQEIQNHRNPRM